MENDIIFYTALKRFKDITGIDIEYPLKDGSATTIEEWRPEWGVVFPTRNNDKYIYFTTIVQKQVNILSIAKFKQIESSYHLKAKLPPGWKKSFVLIADYVNPNLAEKLKEENIQFIDTGGNAYINIGEYFIYIIGNKPQVKTSSTTSRLFHTTGLKIIFNLLTKWDLINKPYRDIALICGVSVGSVSNTFESLQKKEFLYEFDNRKKLIRKKELLNKWVDAYPKYLRKKIIIGRYEMDTLRWNPDSFRNNHKLKLGSEPAAKELTASLFPEFFTLYVQQSDINKLALDLKLSQNENGNLEILKQFWEDNPVDDLQHVVPPMLVYADLINSEYGRNHETAELIYEEYLRRYIEQD